MKPLLTKTCPNCGNEFTTKRVEAKFCSRKCKDNFNYKTRRSKKREKKVLKKKCAYCGKEFTTNIKKKIYCNVGCRNAQKREDARAERKLYKLNKLRQEKLNKLLQESKDIDFTMVEYSKDKEIDNKNSTLYYRYNFSIGSRPTLLKPIRDSAISLDVINYYWSIGAIKVYSKENV